MSEHLLSIYLDEYPDTPWDALKYLVSLTKNGLGREVGEGGREGGREGGGREGGRELREGGWKGGKKDGREWG